MISENNIIKLVLGFKVKYLRHKHQFSYQQLSKMTGLSTSYLHDIEKGKKYPKVDKINLLARAFEVDYDFLVSTRASKKLQPVIDFLTSDFIKEFPLELFGISPDKLFELFSNTPDKVNAFINTAIKLTRNYQMRRENLYRAALRSYQDMYDNYFGELEDAARAFRAESLMKTTTFSSSAPLEKALQETFHIKVDRQVLPKEKALKKKRSYFSPTQQTLFLNRDLSAAQENFLIGREIAFQYLSLQERPFLTRISNISSFEKLLNNFKASYFSVALLMDEYVLVEDIRKMAGASQWKPDLLLGLINKYNVTPEMLLQRMTNILPHHFKIKDLFFIRFRGAPNLNQYQMTKELHLAQPHNPYANELNEHYCRRWVSVNIIKKMRSLQQLEHQAGPIAEAQISKYHGTDNQYLCLSIAKTDNPTSDQPASVTVGMLLNDPLRQTFRFVSDPQLPIRVVSTTCERCSITNCEARAASPRIIEQQQRLKLEQEAISRIEKKY